MIETQAAMDMPVRLHVGGLARGVQSEDLAALIARALPAGVTPSGEIMRDTLTGIERGFGYVTVCGDEARTGAERAIAAYNGTRWKGSKIKVDFATGDYVERLKAEWAEAKEARAKLDHEAEMARAAANDHTSYKPRPVLRLRRRPGERVIFVDPTPIPWAKPRTKSGTLLSKISSKSSPANRTQENSEGLDGKEGGADGTKTEGGHRRRRGLKGSRRKLFSLGKEAVPSKGCRELWSKHLQGNTLEVKAAQLQSVESSSAQFASRTHGVEKGGDSLGRLGGGVRAPSGDGANGQLADEHGTVVGSKAVDVAPEDLPSTEAIEFVWDDEDDDEGGGSGVVAQEDKELMGFQHRDQGSNAEDYSMSASMDEPSEAEDVEDVNEDDDSAVSGYGRGDDEDNARDHGEDDKQEGGGGVTSQAGSRRDNVTMSKGSQRDDRQQAGGGTRGRETVAGKGRGRLVGGRKYAGVEIDDRLAELLGWEDENDGGDYDYELETAEKAGLPVGIDAAGITGGKETLHGISERLQAETQRSLNVLAQVLRKDAEKNEHSTRSRNASSSAVHDAGQGAKNDKSDPTTRAIASTMAAEDKRREKRPKRGTDDATPPEGSLKNAAKAESVARDTLKRTDDHAAGGEGSTAKDGDSCGSKSSSPASPDDAVGPTAGHPAERFVAHLPSLTEIFRVEDKVSTKKNELEKEKDKNFRVVSLFGNAFSSLEAGAVGGINSSKLQNPPPSASSASGGIDSSGPSRITKTGDFAFAFDEGTMSSQVSAGSEGVTRNGDDDVVSPDKNTAYGAPAVSASASTSPARLGKNSAGGDDGDIEPEASARAISATATSVGSPSMVSLGVASGPSLWRPLDQVIAVAARFVRAGCQEDVEAAWLKDRKALTEDFKRKHKDAVKSRRGPRAGRGSGLGNSGTAGEATKRRRVGRWVSS